MKHTLFTLAVFAIIAVGSATNLLKVTKKVKTGTKDEGSGDWNSGYDCPNIMLGEGNAEPKSGGRAIFRATKLEAPSDDAYNLGWNFEFSNGPDQNLLKVLTRVGTSNRYYVPFRYFCGSAKYTNPTGFKTIENRLCLDDGKVYNFKINLPYATFGWYINDEEGTRVCSLLGSLASKAKNVLSEAKQLAKSASGEFVVKKQLSTAAGKSDADMKKAAADAKVKVDANAALIAAAKADVAAKEKALQDHRAASDDNKNKFNQCQSTLNSIQTQIDALNKQIEELKKNSANSATIKADATKKAETIKTSCKAEFDTLLTFVPNRKAEVDAARANMEKALPIDSDLNKIYPL